MAFTAYCKITNITGEAADAVHTEEIQIREYSHQVSQKSNMGSGTGGLMAGGPNFGFFKISHVLDKSTANLNLYCVQGEPIEEIEITVIHSAKGQQPFMKYLLKKCLISDVTVAADTKDEHERPLEHVTFAYDEINWTYTAYKEDGSKEGEYTAGWKLDSNEAV